MPTPRTTDDDAQKPRPALADNTEHRCAPTLAYQPFNSHGVGHVGGVPLRQGSRCAPTLPYQKLNSHGVGHVGGVLELYFPLLKLHGFATALSNVELPWSSGIIFPARYHCYDTTAMAYHSLALEAATRQLSCLGSTVMPRRGGRRAVVLRVETRAASSRNTRCFE